MRNFTSTHRLSLACIAALVLAAPACGDSSSNDGAEGASAGTAETGADSADAAETSAGSMSGDGDGDSGDGDGDSGDGDGDSGDGDGDTGDGDGDTGDGDGDTGDGDGDTGSACAGYETADECDADPACMSLMGQPLQENGPDAPCLQPLDFQGCIDMQDCGDALTWFCVGGNMKPILIGGTCGPDGAEMCDPGVQDPPACP